MPDILEEKMKPQKTKDVNSSVNKKPGLVKRFFKSFVDIGSWVSYKDLSSNISSTIILYRDFFSKKNSSAFQETYEESVKRLGLTEEHLIRRKRAFLYSAIVYFIFALCLLSYFIYLLIYTKFISAFLELIITFLFFLLFYREHFWYMQMKKKRLGCSFHDWIHFILGGRDK